MKFIREKVDYSMTNQLFQTIIEKYKKEIISNKKEIEELNKEDYKYNKIIIQIEDIIQTIDFFKDAKVKVKENKLNNIIFYYGNPITTIQVLLEGIRCSNTVNLCIENQCFAINKLLVTIFQEVLNDYKIKKCISFDTYKLKEVEEALALFDTAIFVGNRNLYNFLKDKTRNGKYIPVDCLDILVLDTKYEDFARDILMVAMENDVEAEIFEDMETDQAIDYLNQYGNKYMILILGTNKKELEEISEKLKYKNILINKNPFEKKNSYFII